MADYIQKDLDLIRMAGKGNDDEPDKNIKKKTEKVKKKKSQDEDETGSSSGKEKIKKRSKTLSPKQLVKDIKKLKAKEELKSRKSMGPTTKVGLLGKIKFSAPKKQKVLSTLTNVKPSPSTEQTTEDVYQNSSATASSVKKAKATEKVASPAVAARSKKSLDPDAVSIEAIRFEEGARIEAVDHGQWYKARIVKIDNKKMDILVHFDGWGSRYDTWFPMTSALIRGPTQAEAKLDLTKYQSGEDVLARWTDGNFYPATVLSVRETGSCNVMYFDGMKKLLRPTLIKKMSEKEKETAMKAVEKLLLLPPTIVDSPQSSVSAGSPSSDGRRYKTSANDRGRRSLVRGGDAPKNEDVAKPARRAAKRRAPTVVSDPSADQSAIVPMTTTSATKNSSDEDAFIAKKARLDKITSNLINKVSPTAKSDEEKVSVKDDILKDIPVLDMDEGGDSDSDSPLVIDEEMQGKPRLKTTIKPTAKRPRTTSVRGRGRGRPRNQPRVPSLTIKVPKPKEEISKTTTQSEEYATSPILTQNEFKRKQDTSDQNRQQAGEALLELSQASTSTISASELYVTARGKHSGESETRQEMNTPPQDIQEQDDQKSPLISEPESFAGHTKFYKTGDIVLAKWADCRSYLAYVLKKEPDDFYKIRYYDGMVKSVKSSFIHPWVGPLPDALKTFKPKSPPGKRQRSKSATFRPGSKKGVKITKRKELVKQRRRTVSTSKTDLTETGRRRRRTDSGDLPTNTIHYEPNEKVLAKWTDLKWYPATVVGTTDNDHYTVKYHDDLIRVVRDTWLTPWKPPAPVALTTSGSTTTQPTLIISSEDAAAKNSESAPELKTSDSKDIAKDLKKPEIGSITESGEVVGLGEQAYRTYEKFNVGDTVLARWTDCRSYPATIKEILDDGKYVVEYYDGMRSNLKPAWLKSWNPSALPPPPRRKRTTEERVLSSTNENASNQAIPPTQLPGKLKPGRPPGAVRQTNMPRQVVRGYDAYYARLPAQDVLTTDHHKFKCRVHGCTKSFRREEMLRTHHKYYHQQRYKLRVQDSAPAPVKKRTNSKEDGGIRRRVSADYESITKGLEVIATGKPPVDGQTIRSRGAKPPIDIYKEQHGNVSISSTSSMLDSSSGADENKQKINTVPDKAQLSVETKLPTVPEFKAESKLKKRPGRKSKRASSIDVPLDTNHDKTSEQHPEESTGAPVTPEPESLEKEIASETINEDVIRCTCNSEEEEGFMIQCDGCFTWQHAACVGFDQPEKANSEEQKKSKTSKDDKNAGKKESAQDSSTIAVGYVCWVCKNPKNIRKSRKYNYNNDYIAKGKLPSISNLTDSSPILSKSPRQNVFDSTMLSSLMEEVTKMQETLTGMKAKIRIAADPAEHPLLETFKSKTITDSQMTETKSVENTNGTQSLTDKELENGISDLNTNAEKNIKEQTGVHKTKSRHNGKRKQTSAGDEDREAYIRQCRENLLDHILSLEAELENRITRLNDFVSSIDSGIDDTDEMKGVGNLQDDLSAVQKLLSYC